MAIGVLIEGRPGTGKSYSIKGLNPEETLVISTQKPILPFRKKFEVVKASTGQAVVAEMLKTDKRIMVVDDLQFILGVPMMERIGEKGWDKFNEIQQPYADVLNTLNDLPDEDIVFFTSHTETDENGLTKIKTIGKALDKYISIEGLFMIVLGTQVVDDKYYFVTQNNGANTLKSPEGMFPSKYIPNDLGYVVEKIKNYYYMEGAVSDEDIKKTDELYTVNTEEVEKPKRRGRRAKREETVKEEPKTGGIVIEEPEKEESVEEEGGSLDGYEPEPKIEEKPKRRRRRVRN